jgi:hypothetical protein
MWDLLSGTPEEFERLHKTQMMEQKLGKGAGLA